MNAKVLLISLAAIAGSTFLLFNLANQKTKSSLKLDATAEFFQFSNKFGKTYYSDSEMAYRKSIFAANLNKINAHNADSTQTYKLGINQFTDMTFNELKAKYLVNFPTVNGDAKCEKTATKARVNVGDDNEVDWVKAGVVQAVKDQAQCGSCWAFATAGALESAYAIFNKVAVPSISEQELVDCSQDYGNNGCNGGLMSFAYDYILDHKINSEDKYPYKGVDQKCKSKLKDHGDYTIKGCVQVESNVDGLVKSIRTQPVAIAFYVQDDFFSYTSGVYNPKKCNGQPNHGVLAVGFNLSDPVPYFYVKNSWNTTWGDNGFFKIAIGKGKGVCDTAGSGWNYYPTL
jgi:C1A family cysteine protease